MKHEVANLSGSMLDLAVARAQGFTASIGQFMDACIVEDGGPHAYSPSTQWYQCGPLIEKYEATLWKVPAKWAARVRGAQATGDTALTATCRAIACHFYGSEFDDGRDG